MMLCSGESSLGSLIDDGVDLIIYRLSELTANKSPVEGFLWKPPRKFLSTSDIVSAVRGAF